MEVKLTEAMTLPVAETRSGTLSLAALPLILQQAKKADILLIGPGLSQNPQTKKCVRQILINSCTPVVLDADGLNAIVDFVEILAKIKPSVIITPHIGEFSRLFKCDSAYVKKNTEKCAKQISLKYGITVVLKSHRTVVASGNKTFTNTSGNPGLATGGSGDVLSGMIAACCMPFKTAFDAACAAVYMHGLSADIAAKEKTQIALLPSDVIDFIPYALRRCDVK
jgi:NAD(P)H-hydrate epimerase